MNAEELKNSAEGFDTNSQIDESKLGDELKKAISECPNMVRLMNEVACHLSDTIVSRDAESFKSYQTFCSLFGMEMAED